jgi:hypothetical protein
VLHVAKLPRWPNPREPAAARGDSMDDLNALESELAPETEVALEVSRRWPVLLLVAVVLMVACCIACRRMMHKDEVTA